MTLKEQYENMSDEELIERYTDSEDYLLEAKIVILEELKKRGLKSKEEINQKLDKEKKEKIEKDKMNEEKHRKKKQKVDKVIKSKITMTLGIMSIISVISLIITLFAVSIYRTGKFEIEQKKEAQLKEQNKVNKINMWEKYPEAFIKEDIILQQLELKNRVCIGKSIRESQIREKTHGIIVGIERNGKRILNPESHWILESDDILWIAGDKKKINEFLKG